MRDRKRRDRLNSRRDFVAAAAAAAATPNKGGHRERAVELVRQAMWQVQAGINFAAAHGGRW
jgi:hypothetical protein